MNQPRRRTRRPLVNRSDLDTRPRRKGSEKVAVYIRCDVNVSQSTRVIPLETGGADLPRRAVPVVSKRLLIGGLGKLPLGWFV